jgi:pimeloyl-ACP methyl ester carboxylesterase
MASESAFGGSDRGLIRVCAVLLSAVALLIVELALRAEVEAKPRAHRVVEKPVASDAPDANLVKESFVRVRAPLPESYGPHPKACDWISYLRFRSAEGPRKATKADAILTIIPGFLGGAGSFDQIARNTVRDAAKRDKQIEFWALDRRSNCLEDDTGVNAAASAQDPSIAYRYYWEGQEVNGKRFPGWVSPQDAAWLDHVGVEQTMRDWYTVLKTGIPSRRQRARKVICGGHSMGGPLTALLASWDFDGDPKTKRDAGYRHCAAFVGLDTRFTIGFPPPPPSSPSGTLLLATSNSGSPYVNTPPTTPETTQLPGVFGVGAFYQPDATKLLDELPHSEQIELAQRLLYSRDAAHFATQIPNVRDFSLTNETVLAGVFDDNSNPLFFIRSSVGMLTGGPLIDKNFPSPNPSLALPEEPSTPLYSWQNYSEVGAGGAEIPLNDEGEPYTSREGEASDVGQLARTMFDAPANFIEQYFPTRLLRELMAAGRGERDGSLSHIKYNGPAKRPGILLQAGDSMDNSAPDTGPPIPGPKPNDKRISRSITIPGYNHLDVLTAARTQNDGRREPTAKALSNFVIKVIGAGR